LREAGLVSGVAPFGSDHRHDPIDDLLGLASLEKVEVSSVDQ
jgi:hypothetical protein